MNITNSSSWIGSFQICYSNFNRLYKILCILEECQSNVLFIFVRYGLSSTKWTFFLAHSNRGYCETNICYCPAVWPHGDAVALMFEIFDFDSRLCRDFLFSSWDLFTLFTEWVFQYSCTLVEAIILCRPQVSEIYSNKFLYVVLKLPLLQGIGLQVLSIVVIKWGINICI